MLDEIQNAALKGLRVLDFSMVIAGPYLTKILGDHGAEIIKVESAMHPDSARFFGAYPGNKPDLESAGYYLHLNTSKLGITINLKDPRGKDLVKQLAGKSEVLVENFSAGTMKDLGLDYESIKEVNPEIIYLSNSGWGQTGPHKNFVAFAANLEGLTGVSSINGFPEDQPCVYSSVFFDWLSGIYGVYIVLAALRHKRKTGQGLYIDLAMTEAALTTLVKPLLEFTLNQRIAPRMGNRDEAGRYVQGCYPCRGENRWCNIAIGGDEEWGKFCKAMDDQDWTRDERFKSQADRLEYHNELDEKISAWTKNYSPHEVMHILQLHGVSAGAVQNAEDLLLHDIHLRARGFFEEINHPVVGKYPFAGLPFKLSDAPGRVRWHAPLLGEHNDYVFKELLHMEKEEFERLKNDKVIY